MLPGRAPSVATAPRRQGCGAQMCMRAAHDRFGAPAITFDAMMALRRAAAAAEDVHNRRRHARLQTAQQLHVLLIPINPGGLCRRVRSSLCCASVKGMLKLSNSPTGAAHGPGSSVESPSTSKGYGRVAVGHDQSARSAHSSLHTTRGRDVTRHLRATDGFGFVHEVRSSKWDDVLIS
jgi:hypothetical protein